EAPTPRRPESSGLLKAWHFKGYGLRVLLWTTSWLKQSSWSEKPNCSRSWTLIARALRAWTPVKPGCCGRLARTPKPRTHTALAVRDPLVWDPGGNLAVFEHPQASYPRSVAARGPLVWDPAARWSPRPGSAGVVCA